MAHVDKEARKKYLAEWYQKIRDLHLARSRRYNAKPETKAKKHADYEANKDKYRAQKIESRRRNPGARKGEWKRWATKNPDAAKNKQLLDAYGITLDEYNSMLTSQNGGCWICKHPPSKKYLDVDHDHETGAVRGLLCRKCNTAVGYIEHLRREHFDAAIDYLTRVR